MFGGGLSDYDDLGRHRLEQCFRDGPTFTSVMGSKKDIDGWQVEVVCDVLHEASIQVTHPKHCRATLQSISNNRGNIVWTRSLFRNLQCFFEVFVLRTWPMDVYS